MIVADGKLKALKDFTIEDTMRILKELEGRQRAEFKMKEVIASLKCRLMDVFNMRETITSFEHHLTKSLSTIDTLKAKVKELKKCVEVRGSSSSDCDREARVEAQKTRMFNDVRDAQKVEIGST